jgi:hypothetical protein
MAEILPSDDDAAQSAEMKAQLDAARAEMATPPQTEFFDNAEYDSVRAAVAAPEGKTLSVGGELLEDDVAMPSSAARRKPVAAPAPVKEFHRTTTAQILDQPERPSQPKQQPAKPAKQQAEKPGLDTRDVRARLDAVQNMLQPQHQVDVVDLLVDPQRAITQIVEQRAAQAAQVQRARSEFARQHPDAKATLSDPAFQSWVKSSRVRTALLQRAHKTYDLDSASHIFEAWRAMKSKGRSK